MFSIEGSIDGIARSPGKNRARICIRPTPTPRFNPKRPNSLDRGQHTSSGLSRITALHFSFLRNRPFEKPGKPRRYAAVSDQQGRNPPTIAVLLIGSLCPSILPQPSGFHSVRAMPCHVPRSCFREAVRGDTCIRAWLWLKPCTSGSPTEDSRIWKLALWDHDVRLRNGSWPHKITHTIDWTSNRRARCAATRCVFSGNPTGRSAPHTNCLRKRGRPWLWDWVDLPAYHCCKPRSAAGFRQSSSSKTLSPDEPPAGCVAERRRSVSPWPPRLRNCLDNVPVAFT